MKEVRKLFCDAKCVITCAEYVSRLCQDSLTIVNPRNGSGSVFKTYNTQTRSGANNIPEGARPFRRRRNYGKSLKQGRGKFGLIRYLR